MSKPLKSLMRSDNFRLEAAKGWLGLGDVVSADVELKQITPAWRLHPSVLSVQYEIYAKAQNWDLANEVSTILIHILPGNPNVWIWHAHATRRKLNGNLYEAKEILHHAEPKFPNNYLFAYNLASYCCQLGKFDEGEAWFKKATIIDKETVERMAVNDLDLEPLISNKNVKLWRPAIFV